MSAQWPRVTAEMLAVLPTLDGWDEVRVFDGPPVTNSTTRRWAAVGFVNATDTSAGSYHKTQHPDGFQYVENGEIRSTLTVQTGATSVTDSRATFFTLIDALEAYIRADRTFGGVLSPDSTCDLEVEIHPAANANGDAVTGIFTLTYLTVT